MTIGERAFAVFLVLFFVVAGGYCVHEKSECDKDGGAFVQGAVGYECVARPEGAR